MAVYHLKVSIGSRAGGQSAGAKADYIEREGNYEKDREELEHKEHGNMPEWAKDDPHSYWKAADEHERANGRLYREVQFALPKELNEEQRRELASGFAKRMTEGERLPYTLAVHRGDGENPHAHLMFSERANDGIERSREQWFRRHNAAAPEKGGARKSRAGSARDWMDKTREAWEREANGALERAGYGERIDHRSLAERRDVAERSGDLQQAAELSREPNVHLGPQALGELPGRAGSFVHQKAERVEKNNQAMVEERDGSIKKIEERIAWLSREIEQVKKAILKVKDLIQNRLKNAARAEQAWPREKYAAIEQYNYPRTHQPASRSRDQAKQQTARHGAEPVMAGIHQTIREARSLYAEALKLQETVLASHRELKGYMTTWYPASRSLLDEVEQARLKLKYMGRGFLALVFMIGTLAGLVGGFLALLLVRLAGGAN